jgi:hypothetical protein
MRGKRFRQRFSDLIALLALFVALGGGAYAAVGNPFVGTGGKIQGCVTKGGVLDVAKVGTRCGNHTTGLAFNAQGSRGAQGPAGAAGTPGRNGAAGATGATGAIVGYSASVGLGSTGTTGVDFSGATTTAQTILTEQLPAGNYVINGKVDVAMSDTGTGGRAFVHCALTDSPSSGTGVVGDTSDLSGVLDYPLTVGSSTTYLSVGTIPLTLATNTGGVASTATIACGVLNGAKGAGTLDIAAANASITAVQTSHNS